MSSGQSLSELGLFPLLRFRAVMNEHTCLKGRCHKGGAQQLSEVSSDRTKGNGVQVKPLRIHFTSPKDIFPSEGEPALAQVAP